MNKLFREEIVRARHNRWLGGASISQPLSIRLAACVVVGFAIGTLSFLALGSYARRTRVSGELVPVSGLSTVFPRQQGVIERVLVAEGERVVRNEPLAIITVPRSTQQSGDTQTAILATIDGSQHALTEGHIARLRQLDAQAAGLQNQLKAAKDEDTKIDAEIATRKKQIAISREILARFDQLRDAKYVSILQIKQQESSVISYESEVEGLERELISARRTKAQLEQALAELPSQRQTIDAEFERNVASLRQDQVKIQADGSLTVTAPVAGVVTAVFSKAGQAVKADQPIMSIVPGDGALEAELLVPSEAIGFIRPADTVLLRYRAYPYQKFGHFAGHVLRISRSPIASDASDSRASPKYRISVALDAQAVRAYGKVEPLLAGMTLDADVLGERRTLLDWLFEPIYSLRGHSLSR
ncbi:membrane fusion protein [Luteibacter jiangsuensis]|uniref:Membrane fusion protein n=1 Tax=Luteibacter jiangsuensis TaxID=637577 RepID=A0ABT9STE6_9GAMM|nr:HlyD family efflux transporter periplasmic adaptor subunit [Luteibacter jiangsuensis]MDQ0008268.1 membrane fusion protein [Luteibacter jiangsuensis]